MSSLHYNFVFSQHHRKVIVVGLPAPPPRRPRQGFAEPRVRPPALLGSLAAASPTECRGVCAPAGASAPAPRWFLGRAGVGGSESGSKWRLALLAASAEPRWRRHLWYAAWRAPPEETPPATVRRPPGNAGRCSKVSLRNRRRPGSPAPEQWVLSAAPFRWRARHHDNHPVIESRSRSSPQTLSSPAPLPLRPRRMVCVALAAVVKRRHLFVSRGWKTFGFHHHPFSSPDNFSPRATPRPQKAPLDARAQPRAATPLALLSVSSRVPSCRSISALTSNSESH